MSWSKRLLINITLFACVLFIPWYIPAGLAFIYYWKYEAIDILGHALLMDLLYNSTALYDMHWIPALMCTYGAALSMILLSILKKKIRFYS